MWASVRDAVAILLGGNLGEIAFTLAGAALDGHGAAQRAPAPAGQPAHRHGPRARHRAARPPDRITRGAAARRARRVARLRPDPRDRRARRRDGARRDRGWVVARFTGTPTRARTVALAALVGTQLGQTLVAGGRSPLVHRRHRRQRRCARRVVQTPGVSQFFGCRPLGPVGWSTAIGAAVTATAASVVVPWATERAGRGIVSTAARARQRLPFPALLP